MADTDDIEFKIARLELGPDDILVVRVDERHLSTKMVHRLREILHQATGGRKCLVIEKGLDLAVLAQNEMDKVLAGKTAEQLRDLFERGEISRNQVRRALNLPDLVDPLAL